ncbi:MAG TPA: nitronate monooxygenase, partial [Acidimicrobiales bacterium]
VQRGHKYPDQARDVQFNPVGQIVGRMDKMRPSKDVIYEMVEECIESTDRLDRLMGTTTDA